MRTWTYQEASTKVLQDLDMQDESFVEADELVDIFNDAIRDAESEIRKLSLEEDYFLVTDTLSLVDGQSDYDLPSDIFNRDIRRLVYHNGSTIYPVRRFKGRFKFEKIAEANEFGAGDDYRYYLKRDSADSQAKIVLVPASRETSSTVMEIYYIRNARMIPLIADGSEAATNATEIDIPEFISFIFAFVKVKIMQKAKEPIETYMLDLQRERQLMLDTLSGFADDDDEVEPDLSHYMEST